MIVYWVALIQTAIYLCAVPMHVAIYFRTSGGFKLSAGFSVFEMRFARKRAIERIDKAPDKTENRHKYSVPERAHFIVRTALHTHRIRLNIRGSFSTGDAAATALFYGSINALKHTLHPHFHQISIDIMPDFSSSRSYADLDGMISLRSGQIIRAALSGAVKNTTRRIKQWINTPSKAS